MEMYLATMNNDTEQEMGQGVEVGIDFKDLESVINETMEGFALIDNNGNEKIYTVDKLNKLFDIVNKNTTTKISYINDSINAMRLKKIYITLNNDVKYILESL